MSGYFFRKGKEKRLAAFDHVPLDRLLIETDAPEMGLPAELDRFSDGAGAKFNHPGNLAVIYEKMARRRGMPDAEFREKIAENFAEWIGVFSN